MDFKNYFYVHAQQKAVEHLMRVVTGLDSIVLGEKQILGQVKVAVERARQKAALTKQFNILTNLAIRAGKKAQNETDVSSGGSSISWAAITMAEQFLKSLKEKSILIIGAGKMGELALSQLRGKGIGKIFLMNRTGLKAEELSQKYEGIPVSFFDIKEILSEVDICICSCSAPHYILEKYMIEKIIPAREGRPLLLMDISMPRNINPDVGAVAGVSLMTIDDLDKVVGENMKRRQEAVSQVEEIIVSKISEFYHKISKLNQDDTLNEIVSFER